MSLSKIIQFWRHHNSKYWIRKALVYGLTALACVGAIIYALQKPYE